eukprot:4446757-Prymnesium_polylepis.1
MRSPVTRLKCWIGPASLVQLLGAVGRVAGRRDEERLVLELHLRAHLDALVGNVRVGVGDGRVLAERAVLERLARLVPLVLELRVDVAGLGGRDHQPRLVLHEVEPRRVRPRRPLEDEQADEDAEVGAIPEAGRQLGVAGHLAEPRQLALGDHLLDVDEREQLAGRVGRRRRAVSHVAEEERNLLAALAVHLPARHLDLGHERGAVGEHLVEVHLHLVPVAGGREPAGREERLLREQPGDHELEGAHARLEHARALLRELLRLHRLQVDARRLRDALLERDQPRTHALHAGARAVGGRGDLHPSHELPLRERAQLDGNLDAQREGEVLLLGREHLRDQTRRRRVRERRREVAEELKAEASRSDTTRSRRSSRVTWRGAPIGTIPLASSLAIFASRSSFG